MMFHRTCGGTRKKGIKDSVVYKMALKRKQRGE